MKLDASQITARLDAGYPAWQDPDSEYWEWDNAIDDLIEDDSNDLTETSIRAFLASLSLADRQKEKRTPTKFTEELLLRHKGLWSDRATFARAVAAPDWADMGEYPSGRAEALEEFGDLIDWNAYTELPQFTDQWIVIQLPDENGVHVFSAN